MMKDVFSNEVGSELKTRIENLSSKSSPQWGTMNVAQMLAHCNVTYEMIFEDIHPKASGLKKILLKAFVKQTVVNDKPYKRNSPTAPAFKVSSQQDFEKEKNRLIQYIDRVVEKGKPFFEEKESNSFGILSIQEWNNMMYKHLDHHLTQFGV